MFLLNELLDDAINSQKKGKSLTYSWLLILISFVAWVEFPNYQVMDVNLPVPCRGSRYQNLCFNDNQWRKLENNVKFYMDTDRLRPHIDRIQWVEVTTIERC